MRRNCFSLEYGVRQYVIIRETYEGAYGFPKGHMEEGETGRETALREIKEETGLNVVLHDDFRLADEHPLSRECRPDIIKTNVYFLAEYRSQPLQAQETEVSEVLLMDHGSAMGCFQYEGSGRLLAEAERYLNAHGS